MKEKKKYIAIAVLCLTAIFGLIACLYAFGFRITYAPELENSWDAISACAAWAGVLSSFIAIWFAIRVPKKISEEQNKIVLFEKRYEVFEKIESYIKRIESNPINFNYSWFLNLSLSEKQVRALFDDEFGDFFNTLNQKSSKMEDLMGDYEYAVQHGSCNRDNISKNEHEIESEITQIALDIKSDFQNIEDRIYSIYLKL